MKYGQNEVYDLVVFNENNELVANIDTVVKSTLAYDGKEECYFLIAKDALLNTDFVKFIGEENQVSDYDKALNNKSTTVSIGKHSNKVCKILAKTIIQRNTDAINKGMMIEIPFALAIATPSFNSEAGIPSVFDTVFKIPETNGEFFKLHI